MKQLTDQLRVPTYFAWGIHDLRQPFRQGGSSVSSGLIRHIPPTISAVPASWIRWSKRWWTLDAMQLAWIGNNAGYSPGLTIVFVHHPPASTGMGTAGRACHREWR